MGKTPFYQILEDSLLGRPYLLNGNKLSPADNMRVANALALWLLALRDLAKCYDGIGRCYSYANLQRCANRLTGCDIGPLISSLKNTTAQLRTWQPSMGCQSLRSFKEHFNRAFCDDGTTKEIIWPFLTAGYRVGYTASWYRDINTISQFLVRLTLRDVDWILDENARSYLQLEAEMSEWDYPSSLISDLRSIIESWLRNFSLTERFGHSSGATNGVSRGKGQAEKFRRMSPTVSGLYVLNHALGYVHPLIEGKQGVDRSHRCAKVNFVPKGIDKKRVVIPEDTFNQYVQSAYARSMVRWFSSHPEMRIPILDQGKSRRLCLLASKSQRFATFDLSSASDTVTYRLMKQLLVGTPLQPLLLARTEGLHVPGYGVIPHSEKMFPMGSIACFPTECLIFSACCKLACNITGCRPNYLVYGDDIIIPEAAAGVLKQILSALHFILNEDKSYGPYSCFLEACGMEAFNGEDISPCRLPRRWDIVRLRENKSPASFEAGIELSNRLYAFGLFEARRAVVAQLLDLRPVAFSVDPERGIYHPDPSNQHLRCRWNPDLCRSEYRVAVTRTKYLPRDVDIEAYQILLEEYQFTERTALRDPLDRVEVKAGPTRVAFSTEWRALEDLPQLRKEEWGPKQILDP